MPRARKPLGTLSGNHSHVSHSSSSRLQTVDNRMQQVRRDMQIAINNVLPHRRVPAQTAGFETAPYDLPLSRAGTPSDAVVEPFEYTHSVHTHGHEYGHDVRSEDAEKLEHARARAADWLEQVQPASPEVLTRGPNAMADWSFDTLNTDTTSGFENIDPLDSSTRLHTRPLKKKAGALPDRKRAGKHALSMSMPLRKRARLDSNLSGRAVEGTVSMYSLPEPYQKRDLPEFSLVAQVQVQGRLIKPSRSMSIDIPADDAAEVHVSVGYDPYGLQADSVRQTQDRLVYAHTHDVESLSSAVDSRAQSTLPSSPPSMFRDDDKVSQVETDGWSDVPEIPYEESQAFLDDQAYLIAQALEQGHHVLTAKSSARGCRRDTRVLGKIQTDDEDNKDDTIVSGSHRPRRLTIQANYAEAQQVDQFEQENGDSAMDQPTQAADTVIHYSRVQDEVKEEVKDEEADHDFALAMLPPNIVEAEDDVPPAALQPGHGEGEDGGLAVQSVVDDEAGDNITLAVRSVAKTAGHRRLQQWQPATSETTQPVSSSRPPPRVRLAPAVHHEQAESQLRTTKGAFTEDEHDIVRKAFDEVLVELSIPDAELKQAIVHWRSKQASCLKSLLLPRLPNRSQAAIRKYCQRHFHAYNRGPWTVDEDEKLRYAYTEHNGRWTRIGEEVGRQAEDCRVRWRDFLSRENVVLGPWSPEEEEKLTAIVVKLATDYGHNINHPRIDWTVVSRGMDSTRSAKQCRERYFYMRTRSKEATRRKQTEPPLEIEDGHNWREAGKQIAEMLKGDKYDVLQEIANCIEDKSQTYANDNTFWTICNKENQGSVFSSFVRRRLFSECLEKWPYLEDLPMAEAADIMCDELAGRSKPEELQRGIISIQAPRRRQTVQQSIESAGSTQTSLVDGRARVSTHHTRRRKSDSLPFDEQLRRLAIIRNVPLATLRAYIAEAEGSVPTSSRQRDPYTPENGPAAMRTLYGGRSIVEE